MTSVLITAPLPTQGRKPHLTEGVEPWLHKSPTAAPMQVHIQAYADTTWHSAHAHTCDRLPHVCSIINYRYAYTEHGHANPHTDAQITGVELP
jgi:hypothetical protein